MKYSCSTIFLESFQEQNVFFPTEVGVHLRRGDKLAMMPGLQEATSPESVVRFLLLGG